MMPKKHRARWRGTRPTFFALTHHPREDVACREAPWSGDRASGELSLFLVQGICHESRVTMGPAQVRREQSLIASAATLTRKHQNLARSKPAS